jgi:hypothetical protein
VSRAARYASVGPFAQHGDVKVERAIDPLTGLTVLLYRFRGAPRSAAAELGPSDVWQLLDHGADDDGRAFAVTHFVKGATSLAERPAALDDAVVLRAFAVLADATARGVAHGDLGAHRVFRFRDDLAIEGYGVPWDDISPADDVRQLAGSLLSLRGHALSDGALDALAQAAEDGDAAGVCRAVAAPDAAADGAATADVELVADAGLPATDPVVGATADDVDEESTVPPRPPVGPTSAPTPTTAVERVPPPSEPAAASSPGAQRPRAVVDRSVAGNADDTPPLRVSREARAPAPRAPSARAPAEQALDASAWTDDPAWPVTTAPRRSPLRAGSPWRLPPLPPLSVDDKRRLVLVVLLVLGVLALVLLASLVGRSGAGATTGMSPAAAATLGGRAPAGPATPAGVFPLEVRVHPDRLPPVALVVVSSPPGSRHIPGTTLRTVPDRVVLDQAGTWQLQGRFDTRLSQVVTVVVPRDTSVVLTFPDTP